MRTSGLDFRTMPGWCAGLKVCNLTNETISRQENTLENIIRDAKEQWLNYSCLVVSVNSQETALNKWLMDNGFTPGPIVKNWNHEGRDTMLCFKQIDRNTYQKANGSRVQLWAP